MRAFLVLGAESSGTKLFTEILLGAGCVGDPENEQRWDSQMPVWGVDDPVVWRRSVPHGEKYPDIVAMIERLRGVGCQVYAYVTVRDWTSMLHSRVLGAGIINYEVAAQRAQWAYPHIFDSINAAHVPYAMVSYEAIVQHGAEYARRILALFGLEPGEMPVIVNGNAKYYDRNHTEAT